MTSSNMSGGWNYIEGIWKQQDKNLTLGVQLLVSQALQEGNWGQIWVRKYCKSLTLENPAGCVTVTGVAVTGEVL